MAASNIKPHGALTFGQFSAFPDDFSALKKINGTSLTIPGQARDLGALLASAKYSGGMVPRHGTPQFDGSFEQGFARMQFESLDEEQISAIAAQAAEEPDKEEEPANDDAKGDDQNDVQH